MEDGPQPVHHPRFMINNASEIERMDVKENPSQTRSVFFLEINKTFHKIKVNKKVIGTKK